MFRPHLTNDRLILLQILHLLRLSFLIVRLDFNPCYLLTYILNFLLTLCEVVDGVAEVQEMLRK